MIARRAVPFLLAAALAGCAIGPNYERPPVASPESYRDEPVPAAPESLADLPFWDVFRDDTLVALIHEALAENYDLRVIVARVETARSTAAIARSELFPQVGYDAAASRGKNSLLGAVSPNGGEVGNSFLVALNAAWELDVWGRIRRASEAARADLLATDAFRRAVVLSLVTSVAQAYFELRELDLELEIAKRSVVAFEKTRDLFDRQFKGGVASRLQVLRAEAALQQVAATVPAIEQQIVAKENQLSVLIGKPAGPIARGATLVEQPPPPDVPPGIPAQLLERRPDLLEAEQTLVATNARVGVAMADFLPRIGLTTLWGSVSPEVSDLLKNGTSLWSLLSSATGPILTFGQNWYGYEAAKSDWEAARARYEGQVLIALQDVSNALTARVKSTQVRDAQALQVAALSESVRLSTVRYVDGLSNYIEVLDAQQQLFPAELDLARAERDRLVAVVLLYSSLGGGWSYDGAAPTVPSPLRP